MKTRNIFFIAAMGMGVLGLAGLSAGMLGGGMMAVVCSFGLLCGGLEHANRAKAVEKKKQEEQK